MTYFHAKLHMSSSNSELLLLCMLFYMQYIYIYIYYLRSIALFQDFKLGRCGINTPLKVLTPAVLLLPI